MKSKLLMTQEQSELGFIVDKNYNPLVSSRILAETFNKDHAKVIRDINNLKLKCSPEFSTANFGLSDYKARGKVYKE